MAYSSQDLIATLYHPADLKKLSWMVDDLDSYAVQDGTHLGWQITLKGRHFAKRANGWIEVDKCGKVLLHRLVA